MRDGKLINAMENEQGAATNNPSEFIANRIENLTWWRRLLMKSIPHLERLIIRLDRIEVWANDRLEQHKRNINMEFRHDRL